MTRTRWIKALVASGAAVVALPAWAGHEHTEGAKVIHTTEVSTRQNSYIKQLQEKARCEEQRAQQASAQLQQAQSDLARAQDDLTRSRDRLASARDKAPAVSLRSNLLFSSGAAQLPVGSSQQLKDIARTMQENSDTSLTINAYTDDRGDEFANRDLSQRRGEAVKSWFVSQGISGDRINVEGKGESEPIASNGTVEGRVMNRRAELVLETGVGGSGTDSSGSDDQAPKEEK
jgi:outer membrane protein OmpA-like peptidoglycan-associated protein